MRRMRWSTTTTTEEVLAFPATTANKERFAINLCECFGTVKQQWPLLSSYSFVLLCLLVSSLAVDGGGRGSILASPRWIDSG